MLTTHLPIENGNVIKFLIMYLMKKKLIYILFAPFIDLRQCIIEITKKENPPDIKHIIQCFAIMTAIIAGFSLPIFFDDITAFINGAFGFSKYLTFFPFYFSAWFFGYVASGFTALAFDLFRYVKYGDSKLFLTQSRTRTLLKDLGAHDYEIISLFDYLRKLHYANITHLYPKRLLSSDLEMFMRGTTEEVTNLFNLYAPFYQAKLKINSQNHIIQSTLLLTELSHLLSISPRLLKEMLKFCFIQIELNDIEWSPQYAKCVEYLTHGNQNGLALFVLLQIFEHQIFLVARQRESLVNKTESEIIAATKVDTHTIEALDDVMQNSQQSSLAPPVNVRKTSNSSSRSGNKEKSTDTKIFVANTDFHETYGNIGALREDLYKKDLALKKITGKNFLFPPRDVSEVAVPITEAEEFENLRTFYKAEKKDNLLNKKTNYFMNNDQEYAEVVRRYAPDFFKNSLTTRGSQLDLPTDVYINGWYATQNNPTIKQKSSSSETHSEGTHTSEINSEHIESQPSQSMEKRM